MFLFGRLNENKVWPKNADNVSAFFYFIYLLNELFMLFWTNLKLILSAKFLFNCRLPCFPYLDAKSLLWIMSDQYSKNSIESSSIHQNMDLEVKLGQKTSLWNTTFFFSFVNKVFITQEKVLLNILCSNLWQQKLDTVIDRTKCVKCL